MSSDMEQSFRMGVKVNVRCVDCRGVMNTEDEDCVPVFKKCVYDLGTSRKPVLLEGETIVHKHRDCYGEKLAQRA